MNKAKLNPITGDMWVPEGEDWNVWDADTFEITYEPIPEDRNV